MEATGFFGLLIFGTGSEWTSKNWVKIVKNLS